MGPKRREMVSHHPKKTSENDMELESTETISATIFISAIGQLNHPKTPNIEGLSDFKGPAFHSAEWEPKVDFTGKSVAVIGSGASAVQILPELTKKVKNLSVFIRSLAYIMPKTNTPITPLWHFLFRFVPFLGVFYRWYLYLSIEMYALAILYSTGKVSQKLKTKLTGYMKSEIKSQELAEILIPNNAVGCKRLLLSSDFLTVLQMNNTKVISDEIERIEADGIRTKNNELIKADGIVFTTGFKSQNFLDGIEISSPLCEQKTLKNFWNGTPRAYWGLTVPHFPNFFILYGPNTNLGHNSIIFILECQVSYVLSCVKAIISKNLKSINLKPDILEQYQKKSFRGYQGDCVRDGVPELVQK